MDRDIREYLTSDGQSPFGSWLRNLRDVRARARIRVRLGNLGDYRSVSDGIYELRLTFGPGYRIYFGVLQRSTVILLFGGDKSTQRQDIERAKGFWSDYRKRDDG